MLEESTIQNETDFQEKKEMRKKYGEESGGSEFPPSFLVFNRAAAAAATAAAVAADHSRFPSHLFLESRPVTFSTELSLPCTACQGGSTLYQASIHGNRC